MRARRALLRRTLGIAATIFVGAAGFALASTLSSGSPATVATVIHACVTHDGQVRILASAGPCRTGEHALTWNVEGPQGPQGLRGQTGPQGIRGQTGPKGDSGSGVTLADAGSNCPSGGIAVSDTVTTRFVCNGAAGAAGTSSALAGAPCTFPEGGPDGTVSVTVAANSHVVSLYCAGFVGASTSTPTTSTGPGCSPPAPQNHATYGCDGGNVVIVACDAGYVNFYEDTNSTFEEEFGCLLDPNEPNNTQGTAAVLAWPSVGNTSSTGDNYVSGTDGDWYTFTAQPGQGGTCSVGFSWSIQAAPGSGTNMFATIDVYRDGTLIGTENGNNSSALPSTDTPGTCSTYAVHASYEGFMSFWHLTITNNGS